jgi:hypothetical protein
MATYNPYLNFTQQLGLARLDMSGTINIALTDTPPTNTDVSLSVSCPPPTNANGYTVEDIGAVWTEEALGAATLTPTNTPIVFTALAGGIGPFQYVICYDAGAPGAVDDLICWWPHLSPVTLAVDETFTVTFPTVIFTNTPT